MPGREAVFEWLDGDRRMKIEVGGLRRIELEDREGISAGWSKAEKPMSKASEKE